MGAAVIAGSVLGEANVDGTEKALGGATVTARNTDTNESFSVTTSSGGVFNFNAEPMSYGTYELTAQKSGYDDSSMTVTASETTSVDATLVLVESSTSSSNSNMKGLPL